MAWAAERSREPGPAPKLQASLAAAPEGLTLLRNDCLGCHTEDLVRQQRLTAAQWAKVIDKMHRWGAPTEAESLAVLTTYLAASYTLDAGPFRPETLSADEAAALFEPLPDGPFSGGDPQRGRALYAERCLICHGAEGRGGPRGVNLVGRHVLHRSPEFVEAVRAGRGGMPAFPETTDTEVADILAHLRSLR
jgi:mono/diheme cytochrome c family protein